MRLSNLRLELAAEDSLAHRLMNFKATCLGHDRWRPAASVEPVKREWMSKVDVPAYGPAFRADLP
jgi:hypothetical protein